MTAEPLTHVEINWDEIRKEFPAIHQTVHGDKPLVYFDNAASSQVPQRTIDRMRDYLMREHSNVHRGVHVLSQRATDAFDETRALVKDHINANELGECVFVRGCTEGVNLVAHGFGDKFVREGDEIIVSALEHHSNIVPWQMLCERVGATLKVIPMFDDGTLDFDAFQNLLTDRTKIVGLIHVSNALGTVNPVKKFIDAAHQSPAKVLIDGCQAMPHMAVDMQDLDADFYAFSAHKTYGPTGVGVLYGKADLLREMDPFMGGGDMIETVTFEKSTYADIPSKFEAGTPAILNVVGFGETIRFLQETGVQNLAQREDELLAYASKRVSEVEGVRVLGPSNDQKTAVLSMDIEGVHPHDVGTILDSHGVAIRAGHHCAQPVMDRLGVTATARASLAFYNNEAEIDQFIDALKDVREIFG